MIELPSDAYNVLEHLAIHGPTFCNDFSPDEYGWCLYLKDKGLVAIALPNPNFLYQLSPERQNQYQAKITGEGMAQYCLIKEAESEKYRAGRNSEADPCYEPDSNDPDKLSRGEKIAIAGVAATIAGALITAIGYFL